MMTYGFVDPTLQEVYLFDLSKKCASQLADFPMDLKRAMLAWYDGRVVSCGGRFTNSSFSSDCYEYDPGSNLWTAASSSHLGKM